jgi:CSLREA domain-containing protein
MKTFRTKSLYLILVVVFLASLVLAQPAYAAGLTVNSDADTTADDGTCTLREALTNANDDSQLYATSGECAAGSGSDTISFDSSLSGATIYLASTLTISSNVTIDGSALASKITISGDDNVRVFQTTGHNLVHVALYSLIVTKGFVSGDGGGLLNDAIMTITNSIFDGNTAENGGAISTNGALTIIDSTFSGNSSIASDGQVGGGAILNGYTLTIRGSTFSGNTADASGGAGGAIYNVASGEIYNSTFSGNSAANAGAILTTQPLTITNSTISGNSAITTGGLSIGAYTTNLANTIIANNSASYGPSNDDCTNDGTLGVNTNNLIEDGSCSPALSGDPGLAAALANNGGPTQTLALLAGSNAIDAGDDSICAAAPINNFDQRGFARPNSAHCDLGAYEYEDASDPSVTSFTVDSPTNSLNIPITAFTASDDATVAAYLITETSTPPSAGAAGWSASAPTTYTVGSDGPYTLYPWVKDAVDNISAVYGGPVSVIVNSTAVFKSRGTQDGWILESSETSGSGGTLMATGSTLNLGDDSGKKQYRSILSFDTASLPDTAVVITKVTLKLRKQGVAGGGNPVTLFQGFMADVKKGMFGTASLTLGDFKAAATKIVGPTSPTLISGWYSLDLTLAKDSINNLATGGGLTQIRVRFKLGDNNNGIANYLKISSGNAVMTNRPQLIVEYYVP